MYTFISLRTWVFFLHIHRVHGTHIHFIRLTMSKDKGLRDVVPYGEFEGEQPS